MIGVFFFFKKRKEYCMIGVLYDRFSNSIMLPLKL